MRELTLSELCLVSGGGNECSTDDGNTYGGVTDTSSVGDDLIAIYEGLVAVTSHIIERVANSF